MQIQYTTVLAFATLLALSSNQETAAQILYTFQNDTTGEPDCTLTEISPGVFYGDSGTFSPNVFSINTAGQLQTIATINPASAGTFAQGQLYPASDGLLYGITAANANSTEPVGSIYSVSLTGAVKTLATGLPKLTPLIEASDGNLYGIAFLSGSYTVFRLTFSGQLTSIASLGTNPPAGPLVQANDGSLYGGTDYIKNAGGYTPGFLYKVSLSGKYTVIVALPENTGVTTALMQASNGLLYGGAYVAEATCPQAQSLLFTLSTSGAFNVIRSISECAQQVPLFGDRFIEASDGFIYGIFGGRNGGGVFKVPWTDQCWSRYSPARPFQQAGKPESSKLAMGLSTWCFNSDQITPRTYTARSSD